MSTAAVISFMALLSFAQGGDPCPTHRESSAIPCVEKELSYCLQRNLNHNQTTVTFLSGHDYSLNTIVNISNIDTICISGNGSTITCEGQAAGLSFTNVTNLHLDNLQVHNCGLMKNNSTASINIMNSMDVTLRDVTIEGSKGTGLILYNTGGQVTIENCTFQNNTFPGAFSNKDKSTCTLCGHGGGLLLRIDIENGTFLISNCKFLYNNALCGGGMLIKFGSGAKRNDISVHSSQFINNSCQYGGGGLQIAYLDQASDNPANRILFHMCTFQGNEAGYGGGMSIFSKSFQSDDEFKFVDCDWLRNHAKLGLAVDANGLHKQTLEISNCRFTEHKPVFMSKFIINAPRSVFAILESDNVKFSQENLFYDNCGSAIEASSTRLQFMANSSMNFTQNRGVYGGALSFSGDVKMFINEHSRFLFRSNIAENTGGAISLTLQDKHTFLATQNCFMVYNGTKPNNVTLIFEDNHANYRNKNQTNRHTRGDSIFASSMLPCLNKCIHKAGASTTTTISEALNCIGNFSFRDHTVVQLSTAADHFAKITDNSTAFCHFSIDKKDNCTLHNNNNDSCEKHSDPFDGEPELKLIPGKNETLQLKLVDELCDEVFFLVSVKLFNKANTGISVSPAHSIITDNHIVVYGRPNASGRMQLSTLGTRVVTLSINIRMDSCPHGYVLIENYTCQCSVNTGNSYIGIERCDETKFVAYLTHGYWMGYINDSTRTKEKNLASAICPKGFCSNKHTVHMLPNRSEDDLNAYVCNANRTGILCGRCKENHSAYAHSTSFTCKSNELCHLGWLFYILSELIPVTLFFLVVIYFNISFTSGPLNGVIFFMQVVDSLKIDAENFIRFSETTKSFARIAKFVYCTFRFSPFKLHGFSFCLWQNASALDILAFKYVTIIYSLFLVFATVFLIKACGLRKSLTPKSKILSLKRSILHGLSTFLVMSYMELTKVSLLILACGTVTVGYHSSIYTLDRAFYNGDYEYLGPKHLRYALPAIFFIATLVVIPPLLLIAYPLCYKLFALLRIEESKFVQITCKVFPLEKIKPLFDSMQGAFKDQYRFFAGLYFLYRLSLEITPTYFITFRSFYSMTGAQLTLFLGVHAVCRPYKKARHNILDGVLFSNLAIINALSFYNYQLTTEYNQEVFTPFKRLHCNGLQQALILLPLIYLVLYMTYHIVLRIKRFCVRKRSIDERVVLDDSNANHIINTLDTRNLDESFPETNTKYVLLKKQN